MVIEWHRVQESGTESLTLECEPFELYDLVENLPTLAAHRMIRNLEACLCSLGEAKKPPEGGSDASGSSSV